MSARQNQTYGPGEREAAKAKRKDRMQAGAPQSAGGEGRGDRPRAGSGSRAVPGHGAARPAFARSVSYGGFESAEARSAKGEVVRPQTRGPAPHAWTPDQRRIVPLRFTLRRIRGTPLL
jgi:hypothetical protein